MSVPWHQLVRDGDGRWQCPHCDQSFVTGRRHYYKYHFRGLCGPAPGAAAAAGATGLQGADAGSDEEDKDDTWGGAFSGAAAALYNWQQREAAPDLEQLLVDLRLGEDLQRRIMEAIHERALMGAEYLQQVQGEPPPDDADADEPPVPDAAEVEAIRRQAAGYIELLQRPLFEGCRADNALHADFMLFQWRHQYAVGDRAFNALLQMLSNTILPEGNLLPGSLYLMRKVLRVKSPADYEYHACPAERCYWPPLSKDKWRADPGHTCACGFSRFREVTKASGRTAIVPSGRVFYVIDPATGIQELMLQPAFASMRGSERTPDKIGSWYASQHYKDLDARTGGELSKPQNSAYDLAIDGVELMHLVPHSTLMGFIRCRDMPAHALGKHRYCKLVLAITGSQQPACMDAYLDALGAKFADLAKGITVVPGRLDPSGRVVKGAAFVHKGFLSGLYADAPARAKVLYTVACFTAYLACTSCRLTATRKGGVNRYLGYTQPVTACAGPGKGREFDMSEGGASERRYNAATVDELIAAAERLRQQGLNAADHLGFHGKSPLLAHLPYIDASTFAVVPFAHAFCQGVAKDFLKAIFAPFPKAKKAQGPAGLGGGDALPPRPAKRPRGEGGRGGAPAAKAAVAVEGAGPSSGGGAAGGNGHKAHDLALPVEKLVPHRQRGIIRQRALGWSSGLHPQKNRPYRDVIKYKGCWQIDDVVQGLLALLGPIFWPVTDGRGHVLTELLPDPHIKRAYGCLRRFAEFHLTEHEFSNQQELNDAVDKAQAELLQYAQLAEQDFEPGRPAALCSSSLCRFNLHHLLCALGWQAKYRGLTVHHLEQWGEREMGAIARATRGKITGKPEALVIQLDLDERALHRVALELGVADAGDTEWGGGTSSSSATGASAPGALLYDGAANSSSPAAVGAIGKGAPLTDSEWEEFEPLARSSMRNNEIWDDTWAAAWGEQRRAAQVHKAAILEGGQLATSTRYLRSRSRNGSRVLLAFATPRGNQQLFAAEVLYYVTLQRGAGGGEGAGGGAAGADSGADGSGGGAGAAAAAARASDSCCLAVLKCFNVRTTRDELDLATTLLEAKAGDFLKGGSGQDKVWAVPLPLIIAPLHTHTRRVAGTTILSFVPVVGRSRRVAFNLC